MSLWAAVAARFAFAARVEQSKSSTVQVYCVGSSKAGRFNTAEFVPAPCMLKNKVFR
jgi:hypothetical protein